MIPTICYLAWMGEASLVDIQRLWFPHQHINTARYHLNQLKKEGYVTSRMWSVSYLNGMPRRRHTMWSLTRYALDRFKDDELFPPRYLPPRARLSLPHDSKTSELITRIIELARESKIFCGIYIEREVRLDPARRRPIMDALIMITVGEEFSGEHLVPWSRNPKLDHERRARFAIENDRNTEPLHVLADKAHSYKSVGAKRWQEAYGAFPEVMFLVPNAYRLFAIMREWRNVWPRGKWMLTTDDWLRGDYWVKYDDGKETIRGLFHNEPRVPPPLPTPLLAPCTAADVEYGAYVRLLSSTGTLHPTVYQRIDMSDADDLHVALFDTATYTLQRVDPSHPVCIVNRNGNPRKRG